MYSIDQYNSKKINNFYKMKKKNLYYKIFAMAVLYLTLHNSSYE